MSKLGASPSTTQSVEQLYSDCTPPWIERSISLCYLDGHWMVTHFWPLCEQALVVEIQPCRAFGEPYMT